MEENPIKINNSGLVLFTPFIPRLFKKAQLLDGTLHFKDEASKIYAASLLQYLIYPERKESIQEDLPLNRIMTDMQPVSKIPIKGNIMEPDKMAAAQIHSLLRENWSVTKETSDICIIENFLQRDGILEEKDNLLWTLTVCSHSYDILLNSIPWSFNTVRFPWSETILRVNWNK